MRFSDLQESKLQNQLDLNKQWYKFRHEFYPNMMSAATNIVGKPAFFGNHDNGEGIVQNHGLPNEANRYRAHTHEGERIVIQKIGTWLGMSHFEVYGFVAPSTTIGFQQILDLFHRQIPDIRNRDNTEIGDLIDDDIVAFVSDNAHACAIESFLLTKTPWITIRSDESGAMLVENLKEQLELTDKGRVLIYATVGTTLKGALDDVESICQLIREIDKEVWLHVDAALFGGVLPFITDAPKFDFELPEVCSMSISGHKFLQMNSPSGITLVRKQAISEFTPTAMNYAGSNGLGSIGSRDGRLALELGDLVFTKITEQGYQSLANQCMDNAQFAVELFERNRMNPKRNSHSLVVRFDCHNTYVQEKYDLMNVDKYGKGFEYQLFCMPHVTKSLLSEIVENVRGHVETLKP